MSEKFPEVSWEKFPMSPEAQHRIAKTRTETLRQVFIATNIMLAKQLRGKDFSVPKREMLLNQESKGRNTDPQSRCKSLLEDQIKLDTK